MLIPKYVVWGQPSCVYCDRAKALLTKKGMTYEYRELGTEGNTKEELFRLAPNIRSVPQIFFGNVHVGGYNELVKYLA